jgi:hypothetical protein
MARCLRCGADNSWIEGEVKREPWDGKKMSTREMALRLRDELHNGVKYDRKRGVYILVWTDRQLRNARRRATRLFKNLRVE